MMAVKFKYLSNVAAGRGMDALRGLDIMHAALKPIYVHDTNNGTAAQIWGGDAPPPLAFDLS